MRFVNREEELSFLEREYRKEGFTFIPIYGRRRVGKTRLIQEFLRGKQAVYFLADTVSEPEQLRNLGRILGEHFKDAILTEAGFSGWPQFFSYLKTRAPNRLVLVVDEFPYLVSANSAISSIFQKGIDESLRHTDFFLILMGSSVGMMEQEVLFYKAPLYGRRTASLEVREMFFNELSDFFPDKPFEDRLKVYAVFGAIPAYLELIDPRKDIFQNIADLVLDRGTFFYNEVEFILREELREPRNYFVLLRAIAQGKRKLGEIINDTGFEKSLVSRYIDILRTLRFVEKEIPITERQPEKSKQGLYRLHDRFFTFWFKYVFPNRSKIEIGRADHVLEAIRDTFEHHLSMAYESACLDLCRRLMAEGSIAYTTIGRWWTKYEEIDIVAPDEETKTAWFGECKWSNKKVGEDILRDLRRKASLVDWQAGKRQDRYILFSKSGFTPQLMASAKQQGVLLIHKDRLVALP